MSQVIVVGSQEALYNFNDDFHQPSQSAFDTKQVDAVSLLPKHTTQDSEMKLDERGSPKTQRSVASSHLEPYHCSWNNSNGGHFAEWRYCMHNGCTQLAAMAWGGQKHKWGPGCCISVFSSFFFLSFVHISTTCHLVPALVLRTIYSDGDRSPQILTPTRVPQLISVQTA